MVLTANFQLFGGDIRESTALPVYATADEWYENALVGFSPATGLVQPHATGTVSVPVVPIGICTQRRTIGASSSIRIPVNTEGLLVKNGTVTGASAATNNGRLVYCSTDDLDDMTLTAVANDIPIGYISRWVTGTTCDVKLYSYDEQMANMNYRAKYGISIGATSDRASPATTGFVPADITLTHYDPVNIFIDPAANATTVTLPSEASSSGQSFLLSNLASGATSLTVADDASATVATIAQNERVLCQCTGIGWLALVGTTA